MTCKLTRHVVSGKRPWRISSPLHLNTQSNCYISSHLCSSSNLAPSFIFIHKDADVLSQYLCDKWIMLVRFQRVRVALVAAQMFCVAYFNTEEFLFQVRFPPFEKSDSQTDKMTLPSKYMTKFTRFPTGILIGCSKTLQMFTDSTFSNVARICLLCFVTQHKAGPAVIQLAASQSPVWDTD